MNCHKKFLLLIPILAFSVSFFATEAPAERLIQPLPGKIDPRLSVSMSKTESPLVVWVFFRDKGNGAVPEIDPLVLARRARVGFTDREGDIPLYAPYLQSVESAGGTIRSRSKWLNGVGVVATREAIDAIARLECVIRIQEVARRAARPVPEGTRSGKPEGKRTDLDFGIAYTQLNQVNVIPLIEAGYTGDGVRAVILDGGFYTAADCFVPLDIADRWDFVNDDAIVSNETPEESMIGADGHGSGTLSVMGGYDRGEMMGPAHGATYYLGKTEDGLDEYPQEEDFWVEGLEWGEGKGAALVSSSLGYIDWYTYEDMDGVTAVVSIAAEAAVARGMVVCNSQGNEATVPWHYLIAPADAPGVIAVGAVTVNGDRTSFSSFGPTADGRIKPDVCALGHGVAGVGSPHNTSDPYSQHLSGTSFSCPLVAGVCALLLEIHPILTPAEVMNALKVTASQADDPDTALGWGIIDAYEAALLPVVHHDPNTETVWNGSVFDVSLELSLYPGFDNPKAVAGDAGAFTDTVDMTDGGDGAFSFSMAAGSATDALRYYFLFTKEGRAWTVPSDGGNEFYQIGDATEPVIAHTAITDMPIEQWPPDGTADVSDDMGIDPDSVRIFYTVYNNNGSIRVSGDFALAPGTGDSFSAPFPFEAEIGDSVTYSICAVDLSGNRTVAPEGSGVYSFHVYTAGYALLYGEGEGPSNPFTFGDGDYRIFFNMPEHEAVTIRIYDAAGRLVRDLFNGKMGPGARLQVDWDGRDGNEREVAQGVYFLRFEAGTFTKTRKIVLLY